MGYCNYWTRTDKPFTSEFVRKVRCIIRNCERNGISIRGIAGTGAPVTFKGCIEFNGNADIKVIAGRDKPDIYYDTDLSHEGFYLYNGDPGFNFCKTARKPYDFAVKQVLRLAEEEGYVTDVHDDGICELTTDKTFGASGMWETD